ncbi:hypothetical protein E2C01_101325 [Portunus trituberculatus]|uniref:Uncharacterized protein n=1 Tax=Portunus trituberculatus TaxID=210409 RepID=A0A5B7KLP3_PORTR|nr:hypothetical protein [Portunus trituberculatus]
MSVDRRVPSYHRKGDCVRKWLQ